MPRIASVHPHESCLVRGGEVARLTPTAAAVLKCLLKHQSAIVSRDDLLKEVWPGLHVTPDLVREYVFHLRAALGDDANAPRYIETIRGRGFRLLGGIEIREPERFTRLPAERPPHSATPAAKGPDLAFVETSYKTVTALYCAIANLPTPADRPASEAAHNVMEAFFRGAHAVLERHEGTIIQYLESGFLALFGAPLTHEDDARRAALAALELNAMLNGEGAFADAPLLVGPHKASMGIATGPIVFGALDHSPAGPAYTARGAPLEDARRLQAGAEGGSVRLGALTYEALRGEIRVSAEPEADGADRVYVLSGLSRARAGVQTRATGGELRLLGRKEELTIVRERFARAQEGDLQIVGLAGPPGIGKSRLVEEFRIALAPGAATILEGWCLTSTGSTRAPRNGSRHS